MFVNTSPRTVDRWALDIVPTTARKVTPPRGFVKISAKLLSVLTR